MFPTNREIWKSISGIGNYEVSNFGRVRNTTTLRILKPGDNGHGYSHVVLCECGKRKTITVHKLVAQEWLQNPDGKLCIDHIDSNRANNHVENLRFATHSENNRNAKKTASKTSSVYKGVYLHKLANKWAAYIDIRGVRTHLGLFKDEREAAEVYNAAALVHYKEFARLNELDD